MIDKISKDTVYLLHLLSEIRVAAGDPEGNLMQDELVEHIKRTNKNLRHALGLIKQFHEGVTDAIICGDWVVDGRCDPDMLLHESKNFLKKHKIKTNDEQLTFEFL